MKKPQHVVTVKLDALLYARIGRAAKRRGSAKSRVIRDAIAVGLDKSALDEERSFYAVTASFAGSARGPRDLSTNPKHMKDFGK